MNYLAEREAITQLVMLLLNDSHSQERTVVIDRQIYRITAERLTAFEDIQTATRKVVEDKP